MNGSARENFRNLASIVTPPAVAGFMAAHGWQLENRTEGVKEIWRYPLEGGRSKYRVMLPLANDYEDYERRFIETLIALSRVYEYSPIELLESINATKADIISLKLNKRGRGTTISIFEAKSVLVGFSGMIENAALRAWNPRSSGRGPRPKPVARYLNENVRFSQFNPESFFIVVLSLLNEEGVEPAEMGFSQRSPYPRRVVSTLANDIKSVTMMVGHMRSGVPVSSLIRPANMDPTSIKNLAAISTSLDLGSIDFSFQWAAGFESSDRNPKTYTIGREELDVIPELNRYLSMPNPARGGTNHVDSILEHQPSLPSDGVEERTLTGVIQGVFRASKDGTADSAGGTANFSTEYEGRQVLIRLELDAIQYSYAIEAHRKNIKVRVKGRVAGSGNSIYLQDGELDLASLKQAIKSVK